MMIRSQVNPNTEQFRRQRSEMMARVEELRALERQVLIRSESKRERFHKRGALSPHERVELLLDRGRPVIELSTLAGIGMHDDDGLTQVHGGGSIAGIGWVSDTRVVFYAHNAAIKGGAISPMGLRKVLRAQTIALENRLPLITLAESAGANLRYQSELFVEGGRAFAQQAQLSAAGIPQVTVVHGSSTAGGAYVPGLSDYVIMVRDQARVFLAGPPLVEAATGERSDEESLGGAEMHARETGLNEWIVRDDREGILRAREVVASLGWGLDRDQALRGEGALIDARPPRYSPDELCGVVPVDYRHPYDPREVIARIVDDSDFLEFKADFGSELITGRAQIYGSSVGIIANHGPIRPSGAGKAAQFIALCCQSQTPLLFLQNTTGFMVGEEVERAGIVKRGAQMIQAVANASVPKITLLIGGAFGAGHYAMCGRGYDPRFIFAWPNNRLAVMGGRQAGEVMKIISRQQLARAGQLLNDEVEHKLSRAAAPLIEQIDRESSALFSTARLWDDGIIDPRDSRRLIGELLQVIHAGEARSLSPSALGVARV